MKTKDGRKIVSCWANQNCGTCRFLVTFHNSSLHEWEDPYCCAEGDPYDDMEIVTEDSTALSTAPYTVAFRTYHVSKDGMSTTPLGASQKVVEASSEADARSRFLDAIASQKYAQVVGKADNDIQYKVDGGYEVCEVVGVS